MSEATPVARDDSRTPASGDAVRDLDAIIIGGGPAGLSAALYLGRARRRVLVIDAGDPRHAASDAMHNFLTQDGTAPWAFRQVVWEQMASYSGVSAVEDRVTSLVWEGERWSVTGATGQEWNARALLLATGVIDEHPVIEGYGERWGHSIHHCPFCHGWELRERPLAALLHPQVHGVHGAGMLRGWTDDVIALAHGRPVSEEQRAQLDAWGIRLFTSPVVELRGAGRALSTIVLADGTELARQGLFVAGTQRHPSLVAGLDVARNEHGSLVVDMLQRTSHPRLWAAGDLTTRMQQVVEAASQGGRAGAGIHVALLME